MNYGGIIKKRGLFDRELEPAIPLGGETVENDPQLGRTLLNNPQIVRNEFAGGNVTMDNQPQVTPNNFAGDVRSQYNQPGDSYVGDVRQQYQTPQTFPQAEAETPQPVQPIIQPEPLSPIDKARQDYETAVQTPAQKQSPAKQALFLALQAIGNIATGQHQPIQLLGNAKKQYAVNQAKGVLEPLQQQDALQQQRELRQEQILATRQKPILEREKIQSRAEIAERNNLMRQYNAIPNYDENDADDRAFGDAFQQAFGYRPPSKNAKTKSQQLVDNSTGQVYLIQTDEQGKEKVVRLLKDDGSPMIVQSNQMLTSADKQEQRKLQEKLQDSRNVTSIKVAEITANNRVQVANINQTGANQRNEATINYNRQKDQTLLAERAQAVARKDQAAIDRIDIQRQNAKTNAKSKGFTDEEIKEMFGDN